MSDVWIEMQIKCIQIRTSLEFSFFAILDTYCKICKDISLHMDYPCQQIFAATVLEKYQQFY